MNILRKRVSQFLSGMAALTTVAVLSFGPAAYGVNATWGGGSSANGNWSSVANWTTGTAAGSTVGWAASGGNTAYFVTAVTSSTWGGSASNPIVIDSATQTVGSIIFDLDAGNYVIGSTNGNVLGIASNATIQIAGSVTSTSLVETINAPLLLRGGTTTFINSSATGSGTASRTLVFNGAIVGGDTNAGAVTLLLRGGNTNNNTINGVMSDGTGCVLNVILTNGGRWLLSGANTFTGNMTVSQGTLVANTIADSGSASSLGAGSKIYLGQNYSSSTGLGTILYTGATASSNRSITINNGASGGQGQITVNSAGTTLTLSGAITTASNAYASTLLINGSGNGILSGDILNVGALSIVKSGAGTWILSGSNTSTGSISVNAGTVQIGNGGTTGSIDSISGISGSNNTVLAFNRSDLISYSGGISGGLSLKQIGSGTLVLAGVNTYTGTTSVVSGELAVNGSLSASSAVYLGTGATLSGSGVVGGSVTGTGANIAGNGLTMGATKLYGMSKLSGYNIASGVTVAGGTTTLTGTTKSTAALVVSLGATLDANGTIDGSVALSGLMKGTSTVTGSLTLTSGTLSPGNSPGITTVNGNFTMDDASKLVMEIGGTVAGTSYDQVKVSGNVSLAGTLDLSSLTGLALNSTITLIDNTGTVTTTSGYFSSIIIGGSTYTVSAASSTYSVAIGGTTYELNYAAAVDGDGVHNDVTLTVTAVPEPRTWAMLIGGLGSLALAQRMRHKTP